MSKISLVVALATKNRAIGLNGGLPWGPIKADMTRFVEVTSGHPVVMGRKTWESIPTRFRPLKNRTNIIVTRTKGYQAEGAVVVSSLPDALSEAAHAFGGSEIMVIGGGEIYREAFPIAQRIYLTRVHADIEGDTFFPEYEQEFPVIISAAEFMPTTPPIDFMTIER